MIMLQGAFGALVDLSGGIKKNEEMKKAGAASQNTQATQSFAGLDGFMKGSPVMVRVLYMNMIF